MLQQQRQATAELQERLNALSARELEVTGLIMQGKSSKEIAQELELSPRTVEAHRANLFAKLAINSSVKLMKVYGELFSATRVK
ncbi:Transcriptional regulatory protein FixJ [compost metagenome]